ncbi:MULTISPECIES: 2-amino-4-hydroxy-6-hydroxymethyldihydropteridine diphosphokinase [Pelosinus]|uniref:2-amino-4-hydroxy-6-hydroxymethyldihydropteridine diphosphokinase n=1 Tax=Pelosinus fermentans B4 TaxID=1149862 RepID=I8RFD9_9FIRM|nr:MULTISPECIES: 2-amino-4-hydroxy-6-hydroxymethyldihydropteridine diphosphokinase [Pelosinus]EIW18228.1 2-amino-4-hydroxy-6-hydroxymethyldihydropteridine pyrophosphokinase [Pelosinus fermentans B4]EIW24032.1 2-amino-4-hydroxy-6-hydroxymethyldihydropteridine pyrophosphokinase [Pelosinus fermentans A11]OAM94040.1 2-amino-4-hydroxy-6-hydroxymethyldihydropteridine pyrophosphokinase [Pelosinus fermentans DSM 17108]SDQ98014.1 2-amino-4-hydroxy-6-hydroxymethyldihydropteridinediphosphokinase [Pelosinu
MIILGLGSNMGDRESNIKSAICELNKQSKITINNISSLYETKPVGFVNQPNFLNLVISINTILNPYELLTECLHAEHQLGRVRKQRWGPRNIDIDILVYHSHIIRDEVLQLPHLRLHERAFVLIPLQEIAYDLPVYQGLTSKELLQTMNDIDDVVFYKKMNLDFL